ncbi:uncharacterized protein L3040_006104 [Drepanopeziza brunnea f. sp. 'multigermtubi']|uniref:Uncharacterized protein n=1 Tax=Marssonina brunnea f. sp. multigermtubi (strain MB_m1) TaxID=1072389 RepID=K1Y8P6_MARBU|nr:uncharacterized protein MBM_00632 [Drepanopeziza brunnea f. sp. 'multigermtubi' MB_m1]EKD21519.1 hypothetical protein MBM_00632 [Drepanopeziza brunnea f. sp. 'multigermtubi' MB_m1]KAJ5040448.1 hypothetical protein L3040_006104 [Drepanopeziza brunnea f. sp. 'multigermtubi']
MTVYWDPREVLGVQFSEDFIQCTAWVTPRKQRGVPRGLPRRCYQTFFSKECKVQVCQMLDAFAQVDVTSNGVSERMERELIQMATLTSCPGWHKNPARSQADTVGTTWKEAIEAFVAAKLASSVRGDRTRAQRIRLPPVQPQEEPIPLPAPHGSALRVELPQQGPASTPRPPRPQAIQVAPAPLPVQPEPRPARVNLAADAAERRRRDDQRQELSVVSDPSVPDRVPQHYINRRTIDAQSEHETRLVPDQAQQYHPPPHPAGAHLQLNPNPQQGLPPQSPNLDIRGVADRISGFVRDQEAAREERRPRFEARLTDLPAAAPIIPARNPAREVAPAPQIPVPAERLKQPTACQPPAIRVVKRRPLDDDPCWTCLMDFEEGEDIVWCRKQCGKNVHRVCFALTVELREDDKIMCGHW